MNDPLAARERERTWTLSNLLSLSRLPLALLFIPAMTFLRIGVLLASAATDYLDGFLARRWGTVSRFGMVLDPLMDKIFVAVVLSVLVWERALNGWAAGLLLSREVFLAGFALLLTIRRAWRGFECRAVRWGKVTTTLQYLFLGLTVLKVPIPMGYFFVFPVLGGLFYGELCFFSGQPKFKKPRKEKEKP